MSGPGDYTVKRIDQMERAFGGAFVRVRAELGITAFGVQVVDLPPNSGELAPEHDHEHDGQEELYVLLSGAAEVVVPDGVVELDPQTFVRLGPAVRRRLRSGPDGARLLMVGAMPREPYIAPANTELGGAETLGPTASSAMEPDGPPAHLRH